MSWVEFESLLGQVGIFAILALSLNMMCGMTGLLQLGQAGFYAVGAYAAGLYAIYFTVPEIGWLNFVAGAAVAMTDVRGRCTLIRGPHAIHLSPSDVEWIAADLPAPDSVHRKVPTVIAGDLRKNPATWQMEPDLPPGWFYNANGDIASLPTS